MKVIYQTEDYVLREIEADAAPTAGDMVYLGEIFFVREVVWYPIDYTVRVYLNDEPPAKTKVAERKEIAVNLNEVRQIKNTADKALKESTNLKRQVFSIRQYLRSQPRTQQKNDI